MNITIPFSFRPELFQQMLVKNVRKYVHPSPETSRESTKKWFVNYRQLYVRDAFDIMEDMMNFGRISCSER